MAKVLHMVRYKNSRQSSVQCSKRTSSMHRLLGAWQYHWDVLHPTWKCMYGKSHCTCTLTVVEIPWGMKPQKLRDFANQSGIQVAQVHVHPTLYSGWICVDGVDNFWSLGGMDSIVLAGNKLNQNRMAFQCELGWQISSSRHEKPLHVHVFRPFLARKQKPAFCTCQNPVTSRCFMTSIEIGYQSNVELIET